MAKNKVPPNKRFGNETDLEAKAKKFVLDSFNSFSNRDGLESQWEKWDKLYNNLRDEKFYEGTADFFPPETRKAVKTLVNFIDETLFSAEPRFQIKGVGGEGDEKKARAIYKMLDWQQGKIKVRMKLRRMLEQYLVKYGTAIVKVVWKVNEKYVLSDLKEREKMKLKVAGGDPGEIIRQLKTIYDNVDFQIKDVHSMYWNYFQDWDEQKIIIERTEVDDSHLRSMEKLGIYKGVEEVITGGMAKASKSSAVQPVAEKYGHVKDLTGLTGGFETGSKHELLEAWCNFDLDEDGIEEECILVLADREFIIRMDPNPHDIQEKPYLQVVWDSIEGTSLGMGVPQLAEKSQIGLCDFVNQIMDNITQILDCMKVVDDMAEIPDIQLKSRPNGIIRSKTGVDAVRPLPPALTANEGLKAVAMCREDIRQGTGATMSLQGLPARYGTTASEYQSQGASSARDIFAKIREIEDRIITEFLRKAYEYDLQFMSREEFIKIIGRDAAESLIGVAGGSQPPMEVREALRGDWDFIPLGVTQLENKVIKGQQLMNFLNLAGSIPPGIVDLPKLVGLVWKYVGTKDDIILPQPKSMFLLPEDENILISQGETVFAKPLENHSLHLLIHQQAVVPPEFEQLRAEHIADHQAIVQYTLAQRRPQGMGLIAPQEQPRMGPELSTEARAGMVPGLPVESL